MIVVIRRTFASSRMTVGQLSVGQSMFCTLEPPLAAFQQRGPAAIPAGQYRLVLQDDELTVLRAEQPTVVLGREIQYGMGNQGAALTKVDKARAIFHPLVAGALREGDDVLLDVMDPR